MALRIFLNGCLLLSALWFPWWVTMGFVLLLLSVARAYEVIVWGIVLDTLYGAPVPRFFELPILFTLLCTLVVVVVEFIKPTLVFYERP